MNQMILAVILFVAMYVLLLVFKSQVVTVLAAAAVFIILGILPQKYSSCHQLV